MTNLWITRTLRPDEELYENPKHVDEIFNTNVKVMFDCHSYCVYWGSINSSDRHGFEWLRVSDTELERRGEEQL